MEEEVDPILAKLNAKNKPSPSPVVEEEDPILKKLNASKKKEPTTVKESSRVGGKAQPATVGSKPLSEESKPAEKSTGALDEYNRRQENLMLAYQNQFQKETEPIVNEIVSKRNSEIEAKQKELQSLVDARGISVDDANKQLSNFSKVQSEIIKNEIEAKQKELLPSFLEKNKKDIAKWNAIYADDFQKKDFQENKITNIAESIWTSADAALTKDLPSSYYASLALGTSGFNKADQALEKSIKPLSDKINNETKEGFADKVQSIISKVVSWGIDESPEEIKKQINSQKSTLSQSEIQKNIVIDNLRKAIDYSDQSAESKKYLINTLDKAKGGDFVDYMNYVAAAVGQGLGQIPASIGTRGTTSIVQQVGSIYLESVQKLAEEESARTGKKVTYEDIIRQGKDDVLWPLITGFAGGLLDAYGANKMNPFNKQEMLNSFRKRAIALGKVVGIESATEAGQTTLENFGISKASGESWEDAFKNFNWNNVTESALQGGIASLFLGAGGQAVNKGRQSLKSDQVIIAPGAFNLPKSPKQVVSESQSSVKSTDDTQGALASADKIVAATETYKPGDTVELSTEVTNKDENVTDLTLDEQKSENKVVEETLTVGDNYVKRNNRWFVIESDGTERPVISDNPSKAPEEQNAELTELKKLKKELESQSPVNVDLSPTGKGRIAQMDAFTPEGRARKWLLSGGKLLWNSKSTGEGKKELRGIKDETGFGQRDKSGYERYLNDKNGISVERAAEQLADFYGDEDVQKYRNALIEVFSTDPKTWYEQQVRDEDADYAYQQQQRQEEANLIDQQILNLEAEESGITETNQQLYENERRVNYGVSQSQDQGAGATVGGTREGSQAQVDPRASIRKNGDANKSKQALAELQTKNLTHVPGLGMGQNQAKGTYISTEEDGSRYARRGTPVKVRVSIQNPFVSEDDVFYNIQREIIQSRFGKQKIEDLTETESDLLAEMVTEHFTTEGFDSIYMPQSETQEGELIVFDRSKVSFEGKKPPATPTEIETESDSPETGKRATVKKMQESDKTTDKTKTALQEFEDYDVRTNKKQMAAAKQWIDDRGDDKALSEITKLLKTLGMPMLMKQAIRIELFDRFNTKFKDATQKGNEAKAEEYFNKMMLASKELAENATDAAQSLQYMSVLSEMLGTVSGAIRFATKEIEESRDGQLRNLKPLIKSAQDMIDEINTMSKDELLKSQKIRDLIAEFSKKAGQGKRVTSEKAVKIFGKTKEQAKKDAEAAISDLYKMVKGGKAFVTVVPDSRALKLLGQWAYNRVIESGISLIEFVQEVQAKFPEFSVDDIEKAWDESAKEADKKIAEDSEREAKQAAAKSILDPKEKKEPTFEQKAKTEKKKELKKSIDSQIIKAVTDFNQGNQEAFEELASSLSEQLEISAEEISRFTESVKNLAEKKRIEIKEKTVKKYIPRKRKKDTEKKKQFYDKILELSDTGALKDTDIQDQAATIMGLPSMTPQVADKIGDFVEAIRKAPEGKFKNAAVIKMLDYIAQQQRFNLTDYMVASYKAGIFSGIDTQAINNISNAFGGMAYVFESFASNPRETIQMIKSLLNETSVAQAWNEAAMLMKTGIDPRFVEEKNRRQLEQRSRSFWGFGKGLKGKWQALDPSLEQQKKYVFRALAAGDVLATTPLSDMAQTAIFRRLAIKQKKQLTGEARKQFKVNTYIQEQMGLTEENIANAQKQAEEEYESGILGEKNDKLRDNIIKIRRDEIIRQSRNPEVVKRANDFAQAQVFVNPPNGFTGILASHLNNAIRDIPLLNALIPVVNIGANITQRGFQYTPPFALLRGAVYYGRNKAQGIDFATSIREDIDALKSGDPFMEQRVKRFVAGTLATIAVLALFHEDDEDDKNLISKLTGKDIKIHGGGPGRIGNMKPTYQKQETGWKPYSMQIGDTFIRYDLIPGYNVLFATMGEYYDAVRYGKMKKKDAIERYAWALSNSYQVVLRNSFFQSVAGTLEGVLDGNPMKFLRTLVIAPISGFAFPKFQRNLINLFDNDIYSANDFSELASRSIPILNGYTNVPMLNALGEPIEKNWWDRVELWSTRELEKEIWNQMDRQNYSLPMPSMANLSESVKADIDSQAFNDFYQYRGESIKKYYEKYKSRLDKIEDKDIYEATFDYIVEQAADEAKYKLAQKNNFTEYLEINDEPITFFYPKYKKDSNGKVQKEINPLVEAIKKLEREMKKLK